MSTVLDQTGALVQLAELWQDHAQAQKRYDPDDPRAKVLERCADDLRRIIGEATPEWVPLRVVQATTGHSPASLRRKCDELSSENRARKVHGRWEIRLDAALELLQNRRPGARPSREEVADPDIDHDTLAKILVRGAA